MRNNRVLEIGKAEARVVEQPVAEPGPGFVLVRQTIAPNCIEHRIYDTGFYEFHEQGPARELHDHAHLEEGGYCAHAGHDYGTLMLFGYAAHEGKSLTWDVHTESAFCWGHKVVTAHFDVNFNHRKDILRMLCDPWVQSKLDLLITHRFPMSRAAEAFELLLKRNQSEEFVGKVHLIPGA